MCKLEKYGNCDEETKNQEYCIFHKPNKSEKEAKEFYEKFLKKFKPKKERITVGLEEIERLVFEEKVDCSGYVFPKIPESVDFSFVSSVFKGDALFKEATFEGIAWFKWAKFEGDVRFSGAKFEGVAWFNGTTFKGAAWFGKTIFKESAWFIEATFEGIANFRGKKEGSEYKFYSKLDFSNTEFRKGVDIDIPSEWFKLPEAEAEACRVQRISYEREGRKDDADRMFVRERRALRRAEIEEAKANVREVKEELKRLVVSSPQKVERVKAELKVWFSLTERGRKG